LEREKQAQKQQFGFDCYELLLNLEMMTQDWLPDDPTVQSLYRGVRKDITQFKMLKSEKYEDLDLLSNNPQ
jgi:hypothetical protein